MRIQLRTRGKVAGLGAVRIFHQSYLSARSSIPSAATHKDTSSNAKEYAAHNRRSGLEERALGGLYVSHATTSFTIDAPL